MGGRGRGRGNWRGSGRGRGRGSRGGSTGTNNSTSRHDPVFKYTISKNVSYLKFKIFNLNLFL